MEAINDLDLQCRCHADAVGGEWVVDVVVDVVVVAVDVVVADVVDADVDAVDVNDCVDIDIDIDADTDVHGGASSTLPPHEHTSDWIQSAHSPDLLECITG